MRYYTPAQRQKNKLAKEKRHQKADFLRNAVGPVRSYFCPDRCVLCDEVIFYNTVICSDCIKNAPAIAGERCNGCGFNKNECFCKGKSNFYKGVAAPYKYEGVVKKGIKTWKYGGADYNTDFFACKVAETVLAAFENVKFDFVTFVPQTQEEEDVRNYNQGEMLAKAVAKKLNIPFEQLLIKIFATDRQHDTRLHLKSGNVFGVYECINEECIKGSNILVVDDVKTSGITLNECAKMLELYDAQSVYCASIAVTMPPVKIKNTKEDNYE